MQCDIHCSSYTACMSTCPLETCENLAIHDTTQHMCKTDTCIEGCAPKACPEGHVYRNSSYSECVLREQCSPLCKVIDGVAFFEGEKVKSDKCHTCFCTRGKVVCKGEPCRSSHKSENHEEGKDCNPTEVSRVNLENCQEYFMCTEGENGYQWLLNNCSSDMMFNEKVQRCEPQEDVIEILPACSNSTDEDITFELDAEFRLFSPPDLNSTGWYYLKNPSNAIIMLSLKKTVLFRSG